MHDLIRKIGDKLRTEPSVAELGTRLMLSTPQPMATSMSPERMACSREMNGLLARPAETVDLHARHVDGKARLQRGQAAHVAGLIAGRSHAPGHHIAHGSLRTPGAARDFVQRHGQQVHRMNPVQPSVRLAAAYGSTDRVNNVGFSRHASDILHSAVTVYCNYTSKCPIYPLDTTPERRKNAPGFGKRSIPVSWIAFRMPFSRWI